MYEHISKTLITKYGFSNVRFIKNLGGYTAVNKAFEADGKLYVLKAASKQKAEVFDRITRISSLLKADGFPATRFMPTKNNTLYFQDKTSVYALSEFVPGRHLHKGDFSLPTITSTAALLARLHLLGGQAQDILGLDEKRNLVKSGSPVREKVASLSCCLKSDSAKYSDLIDLSLNLKNSVQGRIDRSVIESYSAPIDFCHGDFHNENVLYNDGGCPVTFIDFDDAKRSYGVADVTNFMFLGFFNTSFDQNGLEDSRSFIASYSKIRPLNKKDITYGVERYFERLVTSTFLENCLTNGNNEVAALLDRDVPKIMFLDKNRKRLIENLIP